jgi:hypothetical protein
MTTLVSTLTRSTLEEDGKISLIKKLRSDADFLSGVRRGLEARRKSDRLHWNDVKAELGIE